MLLFRPNTPISMPNFPKHFKFTTIASHRPAKAGMNQAPLCSQSTGYSARAFKLCAILSILLQFLHRVAKWVGRWRSRSFDAFLASN
jgi:hypothetical protein